MRRAVFMDRDGTINVDFGYVYRKQNLRFLPNAVRGLRLLQDFKYLLIIVSNQSGIGRGYYTLRDYRQFTNHFLSFLKSKGVRIHAEYMCPHKPSAHCTCRKPKLKNYKKAIREFVIDTKASFVIGDKTEDIRAGSLLGCRTILVKTGKAGKDNQYEVSPDYRATNLYDASLWIKQHG